MVISATVGRLPRAGTVWMTGALTVTRFCDAVKAGLAPIAAICMPTAATLTISGWGIGATPTATSGLACGRSSSAVAGASGIAGEVAAEGGGEDLSLNDVARAPPRAELMLALGASPGGWNTYPAAERLETPECFHHVVAWVTG